MVDYGDIRIPDTLWDAVEVVVEASTYPGPCWIWTRSLNEGGYANLSRPLGRVGHKIFYRSLVGDYPETLQLDHLCRVRPCVNPDHLEPVTAKVNRDRGRNANSEKSSCKRGHLYDEANTIITPSGARNCRTCHNERRRTPGATRMQDRTHCPEGHEYDEANTGRRPNGSRYCRSCHNARQNAKRKAETPEQRQARLDYLAEYRQRNRRR